MVSVWKPSLMRCKNDKLFSTRNVLTYTSISTSVEGRVQLLVQKATIPFTEVDFGMHVSLPHFSLTTAQYMYK